MDEQPICCACWNRRHPDNPINTGGPVHGLEEICQDCGGLTTANVVDVPADQKED